MTGGNIPGLTPEQQNTQWYYDTMQQYDPKGYQEMRNIAGPSPIEQQQAVQQYLPQQEERSLEQAMASADQQMVQGNTEAPFENVPAQEKATATTSEVEATPQTEASKNEFEAIQYGAPITDNEKTKEEPIKEKAKQEDPLENVQPQNPWDTKENREQINIFQAHKERLNIKNDKELLPHVREFFKDEKATISSITPDILKGFNEHLQNIQV